MTHMYNFILFIYLVVIRRGPYTLSDHCSLFPHWRDLWRDGALWTKESFKSNFEVIFISFADPKA